MTEAPDGWSIRLARPSDLAELVRLEQTCFSLPWSEDSLRRELTANPSARIWVAETPASRLAGYAALWVVLEEGQINNIAVDPAWRRQGIGRLLLQTMSEAARKEGLTVLFLEVRTGNLPARRLYESLGFRAVGLRKGYYPDNGEDAIIMLKNLI